MKKALLILGTCFSTALSAQITVTSSDMPNAGDSVLVSVTYSVDTMDFTLADSAYTWDYSTLVPAFQRYEKFDSPFGFPLPFSLIFNPFNTSYGNENNLLTSLPIPGLTLDMAYDYLKESSSKFRQVGAGYTINGAPLPFLYSSDDIIYRFPMNYLNTDSCDYKFGLPIPGIGYYGQTGHRVNTVDGWGTLITPYGTFNTLRVKSTIAAVDTIYIDAFGFGTNSPQPLRYEYKWLANGKQIPVLHIDASDIGGFPVITNVQYIDSVIPGVPQLGIADHAERDFNSVLFPNPAVNTTTFQYTLISAMHVKIRLADITGRTIAVVREQEQTKGNYREEITVSDLSDGIYMLILETDKGRAVHRIVVSK